MNREAWQALVLLLWLLCCFSHVRLLQRHKWQPIKLPVPGILQARILEWCREPARGVPPVVKVMRLRGPTGKGESGLKGALLDLLVHLPQNKSLPALLHYAFCLRF